MPGPFRVDLKDCAKYEGQVLSDDPGWKNYKGEKENKRVTS